MDTDNDGKFTSGLDQPDYIGDEQLYYVSNDLNAELTTFLYGSPPVGLEIQQTLLGFNRTDELADVVFKKVQFINKSQDTLVDMYVSYFTDDILGNAMDNFVGCDTTLSLGYTYNSDNEDEEYYGFNPPSIGHQLLQGPIVSGAATDSALFKGIWKKGYKNLPMTGFVFYVNNSYIYKDPSFGVYNGSVEMYNNMQSLSHEGTAFIDPIGNTETKFCLSGDPVGGTGWYQGDGWPSGEAPGEHRYLMSSGPFTMAPGDTQEVVYAIFMARGSSNINSVAKLKSLAGGLKEFHNTGTLTNVQAIQINVPANYELFQNYPNPFNPTTTITYQIPKNDHVTVKVYDILGREVATLVNQFQKVGKYNVELNAANLASGVYMYSIQTTDYRNTKKMILMK